MSWRYWKSWRNLYSKAGIDYFWRRPRSFYTATHFHYVNFCHVYFVGHASEDRIILVSSGPRSLNVRYHFELKVKRCIERGVVLRAAYAQIFEGQERIKRDRKCVWKPQSPRTKFRINANNSNKGYFVLVLQ